MTTPLYVFDLDGTLADLRHRLHFIKNGNKDYDSFYAMTHADSPILGNIRTLMMLREFADIWFVTGRPERTRQMTVDWLAVYAQHKVQPEHLIMRPDDCTVADYRWKAQVYGSMLQEDQERLIAVFEDRQRCVDMWRALGITCYQVAPGNF